MTLSELQKLVVANQALLPAKIHGMAGIEKAKCNQPGCLECRYVSAIGLIQCFLIGEWKEWNIEADLLDFLRGCGIEVPT